MKTIEDLKQLIKNEEIFIKNRKILQEYKGIKASARRLDFYKSMLKYLETNPNEKFLEAEKERLSKIIKAKVDKYEYWVNHVCDMAIEPKKRKTVFNSENGLTRLRR